MTHTELLTLVAQVSPFKRQMPYLVYNFLINLLLHYQYNKSSCDTLCSK